MAEIAGALIIGLVVGLLTGIGMTWDRRFNAGRAYGYRQGCESAVDNEMIDRIRGAL